MILAAISEAGWVVLGQAAIAACVTVALAWVTRYTALKTAKTLLDSDIKQNAQLNDMQKVGVATHVLVNNNMAIQLRENAELRRWKADQTKDPLHIREADVAELLYREHQMKQAVVDKQQAVVDRAAAPMKTLVAITIAAVVLCGCTTFSVTQTDTSPNERIIESKIHAASWFSSSQSIAKLKAVQTDKTQSFGTEGARQQGATNTVAALEAVARILEALRPTP